MQEVMDEQYKKEYEEARAKLEAEANPTTAEEKVEPEQHAEEAKPEDKPSEEAKPEDSEKEELRKKLASIEKALKDTQAWGTKQSQRLAEIEKQRKLEERELKKPQILENNPDLADAIRYVTHDPAPVYREEEAKNAWKEAIEVAHPGVLDDNLDKELQDVLYERLEKLGPSINDPLVAIREITAGKLEYAERQLGKRFAQEAQKQASLKAMSVPSGSSGGQRTVDSQLQEVNRIKNMSDSEFAREVARVKGFI